MCSAFSTPSIGEMTVDDRVRRQNQAASPLFTRLSFFERWIYTWCWWISWGDGCKWKTMKDSQLRVQTSPSCFSIFNIWTLQPSPLTSTLIFPRPGPSHWRSQHLQLFNLSPLLFRHSHSSPPPGLPRLPHLINLPRLFSTSSRVKLQGRKKHFIPGFWT